MLYVLSKCRRELDLGVCITLEHAKRMPLCSGDFWRILRPNFSNTFLNQKLPTCSRILSHAWQPTNSLNCFYHPAGWQSGTVSCVLHDWSGAHHPLIPVIKLGLRQPRTKRKKHRVSWAFSTASRLLHSGILMMVSDVMLSSPTSPLHCATILQPATPPHVVAVKSWNMYAPICLDNMQLWFHSTLASSNIKDINSTDRTAFFLLTMELKNLKFCVCDRNDATVKVYTNLKSPDFPASNGEYYNYLSFFWIFKINE